VLAIGIMRKPLPKKISFAVFQDPNLSKVKKEWESKKTHKAEKPILSVIAVHFLDVMVSLDDHKNKREVNRSNNCPLFWSVVALQENRSLMDKAEQKVSHYWVQVMLSKDAFQHFNTLPKSI
jgi:hypothetical protein